MKKKISGSRLVDVARLANVSLGTVDRVIHNRGRVSEETKKKVNAALKQINYKPNVAAQILSIRKKRRIGILVPEFKKNDYWEQVERGIAMAETEMGDYGFIIERFHFSRFIESSFHNQIQKIKQRTDVDGFVISPHYREDCIDLTSYLSENDLPFIYIDSMIDETNSLSYFGIDSYRAGYALAKLLSDVLRDDDEVSIVNFLRENQKRATQVNIIDDGFCEYLNKSKKNILRDRLNIVLENENWEVELLDYLKDHPHVKGFAVFNSLAHKLADFFEKHHIKDMTLVGFDAIKDNVRFLKKGYIKYLISQRPEYFTYSAIKSLCQNIAFHTEVAPINFMPIDILIAENIDFYQNLEIKEINKMYYKAQK